LGSASESTENWAVVVTECLGSANLVVGLDRFKCEKFK
jgi:hypothetical protein